MTTKRDDLDHVRTAGSIICYRRDRRPKKCYACGGESKILCDHPKEPPPELAESSVELPAELALQMTTCSRPCCGRHGCWWTGKKHLCQEHAQQKGVWA